MSSSVQLQRKDIFQGCAARDSSLTAENVKKEVKGQGKNWGGEESFLTGAVPSHVRLRTAKFCAVTRSRHVRMQGIELPDGRHFSIRLHNRSDT